jgi:hypothetical protein
MHFQSQWGRPTHKIFFTEDDTKIIREKKKIAVSGAGYVEVDKRDQDVVGFYFENFDAEDEDALAEFINLIKPLYYKRFAT